MWEVSDEEIRSLVEKLLEKILSSRRIEVVEGGLKKRVTVEDEHGVYVYRGGEWVLMRKDGEAFKIGEFGDGVYVVYFDNTKCPACRLHDSAWFPFVEEHSKEAYFVIILCEWFARKCESQAASKTFLTYRVKASPTTIFARVENGEIVYQEKKEGYMSRRELEEELSKALARETL